jgi:HlyD family secretion protein
MKKGAVIGLVIAGVAAVAAGAALIFGGALLHRAAEDPTAAEGYATVAVSRTDLTLTVPGSGQFEPNTIAIVRPDSNMPTRKVIRILVVAGQRVHSGQALVEIDSSGLDLDLAGAQANYEAQQVKLRNLEARPADLEVAQGEANLTQARLALDAQQQNYDSVKALADKQLASRNQLADAERQLELARAQAASAELTFQNVKAQSQADTIHAQEAAVAQADSELRKARLVWDSRLIRSPIDGMVAEINVNVGDMVGPSGIQGNASGDKYGPSTAIMTVVQSDPMILLAQVNETDMANLRIGESATVTATAYPDLHLVGTVTQIDLHAQVVSNVSVFNVSIEVPNPDGKLLWGMNADADIAVQSLPGVLTLPAAAVHATVRGAQVSVLQDGKVTTREVKTGVSDGVRTQIVAGLEEGQEVLVQNRSAPAANAAGRSGGAPRGGGPPNMGQVFRVLH